MRKLSSFGVKCVLIWLALMGLAVYIIVNINSW